jgi:hypothetical protein
MGPEETCVQNKITAIGRNDSFCISIKPLGEFRTSEIPGPGIAKPIKLVNFSCLSVGKMEQLNQKEVASAGIQGNF